MSAESHAPLLGILFQYGWGRYLGICRLTKLSGVPRAGIRWATVRTPTGWEDRGSSSSRP